MVHPGGLNLRPSVHVVLYPAEAGMHQETLY